MYLTTGTRCGSSAKQLVRELGVTYKTAWRMAFGIRNKLIAQDGEQPIGQLESAYSFGLGGIRPPG